MPTEAPDEIIDRSPNLSIRLPDGPQLADYFGTGTGSVGVD